MFNSSKKNILIIASFFIFESTRESSAQDKLDSNLKRRGELKSISKPQVSEDKKAAALDKRKAPSMADKSNFFENKARENLDARQDELRVKSINTLISLLKNSKDSVQRFELMRRLGEQYIERHDYLRSLELDLFEKRYDAFMKGGQKTSEPKADFTRSVAALRNGSKVYESMAKEFAKRSEMDLVIHELAKTLLLLGDERGVAYFKRIPSEFPKSPLVPDAYLGLGEYYFDKLQMEEARKNYVSVLEYKSHSAYAYALFKLGWTHYNLASGQNEEIAKEQFAKSLAAFKLVIKIADRKAKKGQRLLLRDEALKDLVMVYAETEDVEGAWEYFKSINETEMFYVMLERLGGLYVEQGKNEKAVTVYERLLKESPLRPNNPLIASKLTGLYYDLQSIKQSVQAARSMCTVYLEDGEWLKANQKDIPLLQKIRADFAKTLHRIGTMYHDDGSKSGDKASLQAATVFYALYLKYFPDSEQAYELRYYLADIQFTLEQFEKAADNFTIVANSTKPGQIKYRDDSAYNAVVCMNNVVNAKEYPKLPPLGKVPIPINIPSEKKKLVEVLDNYVRLLPKNQDGFAMRYSAAQTLFEYGHYKESIPRFEKIVLEIPKTKQSLNAVKVVLSFYADSKQWPLVMERAKLYLQTKNLLDEEMEKFARALYVTAAFERAGTLEKEKKYDEAADAFRDFQRNFPKDSNAPRALYNAYVNYMNAAKVPQALQSLRMILVGYPSFEKRPDVAAQIAETYEKLAMFSEAAASYEEFYRLFPNDKRGMQALYNAALLNKAVKKIDPSLKLFSEFVRSFPKSDQVMDASFEIAQLQRNLGNKDAARLSFQSFANRYATQDADRAFEARAISSLILYTSNDKPQSDAAFKEFQTLWQDLLRAKETPAVAARRLVAKIFFEKNNRDLERFLGDPMKDAAEIQAGINAKQKQLERVAKNFQDIILLKSGEYTAGSLFQLGLANEHFSKVLVSAKLPPGLTKEEENQYRDSLSKASQKLLAESTKFYEQCYQDSSKAQVFSEWTKKAYEKLSWLKPTAYSRIRELQVEPGYLLHTMAVDPSIVGVTR